MSYGTRWFRPWGLGVFVAVAALLVTGFAFFADSLVKRTVESVGSDANGAKVDLAGARLSLSPLGFTLTNLQVTDAGAPMSNAVQIDRIRFALESDALLRRKFVITDLSAEGVRFNTPRSVSGALPKVVEPTAEPESPGMLDDFELPKVDLPDVGDVLLKEDLASKRIAEQLRADLEQAKTDWPQRLAGLPDDAVLKSYDERIQQARPNLKGNTQQDVQEILDGIKRLETLRDDVGRDVDRVKDARQAWDKDWKNWAQQTRDLMAAPGADLDRLREKYSLDAKGFANASRALFGGEAAHWGDVGLTWYKKISVLLASRETDAAPERRRGKGIDIPFPEHEPLPDFLIRSAKLTLEIPAGAIKGEVRNITHDQPALGRPMTLNFFAEKMQGLDDIEIEGMFNHVTPGAARDSVSFKAHGLRIGEYALVQRPEFPLSIAHATVDLDGAVTLQGDVLDAKANAAFREAALSLLPGKSSSEIVQVLAAAFADVKSFNLAAKLSGTLQQHDVDLRSDLDDLLRDALNRQFRQRSDKFLADARARLDGQVRDARQQIEAKLGDLKTYESQLEQRRKQMEEASQKIQQALRAAADKQKEALTQKAQQTQDAAKKDVEKKLKNLLK